MLALVLSRMRLEISVILISAVGVVASPALAIDWTKKDFRPFGYHTQQHFWASTGATFAGQQVYQYFGMDREPALAIAALQVYGIGVGKEFFVDPRPGVNDLIADGLGVLLGTFASVKIHFDFPHRHDSTRDPRVEPPQPVEFENDR